MSTKLDEKEKELLRIFGNRVREYRQHMGYTQEKVADLTEIDRHTISNIENGKENFSYIAFLRLIHALGMPAIPVDYTLNPSDDELTETRGEINVQLSNRELNEMKMALHLILTCFQELDRIKTSQ